MQTEEGLQGFEITEPSQGVPEELFPAEGFVPTEEAMPAEYYVINDAGLAVPSIGRELPGSGTITQSQVITEFNMGSNLRAYLGAAPGVPSSGNLKLTDFYGKSASNAVSAYVMDYYKHNSSNQYGGNCQLYCGSQGSGQLPSDSGDYYWPIADKPFEIRNDPEMPTFDAMNSGSNAYATQPSDGTYDNVNIGTDGISGSVSTGNQNGAHFRFRRSKGFALQKVLPGRNTFQCEMFADFQGDPVLGTLRTSKIRAYVREFDNPVSYDSNFLRLSTKGNRHYVGEAYMVYSNGRQTKTITVDTTMPYIFVEVYFETNSYSAVNVAAIRWKVNP